MAVKELEIKIRWENENLFEMTAKEEGSLWLTVVKIEENATIKQVWPHVYDICQAYFIKNLNAIGAEMKT